jgi:hypothetical protein
VRDIRVNHINLDVLRGKAFSRAGLVSQTTALGLEGQVNGLVRLQDPTLDALALLHGSNGLVDPAIRVNRVPDTREPVRVVTNRATHIRGVRGIGISDQLDLDSDPVDAIVLEEGSKLANAEDLVELVNPVNRKLEVLQGIRVSS